jgi:hypothetical protein
MQAFRKEMAAAGRAVKRCFSLFISVGRRDPILESAGPGRRAAPAGRDPVLAVSAESINTVRGTRELRDPVKAGFAAGGNGG